MAWARARESWWPFGKSEDPTMGLLVRFDERRDIVWPINPRTGNAARNFTPALLRKEVETCGLCHARRGGFSEDWVPGRPLSDTHVVSPLARGLYHADGQMRDEVYNYGSFKQSRMFAAGVTCSDCHEPHSAKLRAPARRRLPAMSLVRQVRSRHAPSPRSGKPAALLRVLPYADPHLHGRRPAARSRLPCPAARSIGKARHAQCLQRLPQATNRPNGQRRRSNAGMGRIERASRIMPKLSTRRGMTSRMRQLFLPPSPPDRQRAGFCAGERVDGVEFARRPATHQRGSRGPFRP